MNYTKYIILGLSSILLFTGGLFADEAFAVKAKGKETIELRFNGRMQAQYDSLTMNDLAQTNHFYFRRLFLGAKAKLSNGIYAESVFDFASDGYGDEPRVAFDKAIIGYKFSNGVTGVLGFQKVPFGFEETTSSSKLQTIERSAINRFFADDIDFSSRHMGLHAKGKLENGLSYAWSVVNSAQGEGSRLGGSSNFSNDLAAFARLQWKQDDVIIGVDYGDQTENLELDADVNAYTTYINLKSGNLNLLGEYFSGDLGAGNDTEGYALRASIRNGKWEPVIRFSSVESDWKIDSDELIRRAPEGGDLSGTGCELDSTYVGLNYYYSKAVTFMAGYEDAESTDGSSTFAMDGLRARVQVLW